jgi:hypothetical protein
MFFSLEGGVIQWGGTVANGGTGELVLGAGAKLIAVPGTTPTSALGAINEGTGTRFPTRYYQAVLTSAGTDITFVSKLFAFDGAADLSLTLVDSPASGVITVSVEGDATVPDASVQPGRRAITVTFDSLAGHDFDDLEAVIAGDIVASVLIEVPAGGNPTGATLLVPFALTAFSGGADGVFHEISDAQLGAAFAGTLTLREGSTLAIWYDSVRLRRQSVEENANKHLIPAASLVSFDAGEEKTAHSVIIGRVINDVFVLADGNVLDKDTPVATLHSNADVLRADLAQSHNVISPYPTRGAPGVAGIQYIGIPATDYSFIPTSSTNLGAAIEELDLGVYNLLQYGADTIRRDVQRGITAPPAALDAGSYGAEYVGIDNLGAFDTILPGTESVQGALTDIDNELAAIHGTGAVAGVGTVRIESLSDDYPEINASALGDDLRSTLLSMYARLQSHDSLQGLIEASYRTRAGLTVDTKRFPQFLSMAPSFAGTASGSVLDAGDWEGRVDTNASTGGDGLSADGRYVCTPGNDAAAKTSIVNVYNASDLTLFATVTLTSVPTWGITAVASDGYSLAVAYDSKIEMFDLTAGPPAKDAAWATAGIHTHTTTASININGMRLQGGRLYYVAAEADATGSAGISVGDNIVVLSSVGAVVAADNPIGGNGLKLDVYGEYIAYISAGPGSNVCVCRVNGALVPDEWSADYTTWNALHAIAINEVGVAIAGLNLTASDPQVEFLSIMSSALLATANFNGLDYAAISLTRSATLFFAAATPTTVGTAVFRCYNILGANSVSGGTQAWHDAQIVWEFSLAVAASILLTNLVTDGVYIYVTRISIGAGVEQIRRYSIGTGSGHWVVGDAADVVPFTASPIDGVYLYGR